MLRLMDAATAGTNY